jgi:hypothetical protein
VEPASFQARPHTQRHSPCAVDSPPTVHHGTLLYRNTTCAHLRAVGTRESFRIDFMVAEVACIVQSGPAASYNSSLLLILDKNFL